MSDDLSKEGSSEPESAVQTIEPDPVPPIREGVTKPYVDPMEAPSIAFSSTYPRTGRTVFGQTRPPGIYWDTISTAFTMITSNFVVYGLAGLTTLAVGFLAYSLLLGAIFRTVAAGPSAGMELFMILPQVVVQYLLVLPMFGLVALGVRHAQGNVPKFDDFLFPFRNFKKTAFAALLVAAPLIGMTVVIRIFQAIFFGNPATSGLVLLVLFPVAILVNLCCTGQLLLSGTASIFNGQSPIDTAKKLYGQMGNHIFMFGLLFMVAQLVSFAGALAFCVGVAVTLPVCANVIGLHYVYNFPEDQKPIPNPNMEL